MEENTPLQPENEEQLQQTPMEPMPQTETINNEEPVAEEPMAEEPKAEEPVAEEPVA